MRAIRDRPPRPARSAVIMARPPDPARAPRPIAGRRRRSAAAPAGLQPSDSATRMPVPSASCPSTVMPDRCATHPRIAANAIKETVLKHVSQDGLPRSRRRRNAGQRGPGPLPACLPWPAPCGSPAHLPPTPPTAPAPPAAAGGQRQRIGAAVERIARAGIGRAAIDHGHGQPRIHQGQSKGGAVQASAGDHDVEIGFHGPAL